MGLRPVRAPRPYVLVLVHVLVLVLVLAAGCDASTGSAGLTFEVLAPEGFDWSRVATLSVDLDDGSGAPAHAEAAVEAGSFDLSVTPADPNHVIIARAVLLDAAGVELASGATPPFVPVEVPSVTLRVLVAPRGGLSALRGLLP